VKQLVDVYDDIEVSQRLLFELMREREPHQNISHKELPGWDAHCSFIAGRPHLAWCLLYVDDYARGAVYLTHQREIGVGILRSQRGKGYAKSAITELMRLHPGRFLANINPQNEASIALFKSLGFGGPIQITLERQA
jgi:RimJ/RimL family protein N-acetyltransferase